MHCIRFTYSFSTSLGHLIWLEPASEIDPFQAFDLCYTWSWISTILFWVCKRKYSYLQVTIPSSGRIRTTSLSWITTLDKIQYNHVIEHRNNIQRPLLCVVDGGFIALTINHDIWKVCRIMSQNCILMSRNNTDHCATACSGHVLSLECVCQAGGWARDSSFIKSG